MNCPSCEMVAINGVACHEQGCPDAWKSEIRECKECGALFSPQNRAQPCCDEECFAMYYGLPLEPKE